MAVFLILPAFLSPAEPVDIVLLHTASIRGHVFSLRYREHLAHHGGLLRCSTLIRNLREVNPRAVLIDGGGLIEGSAESDLSAGRLPLEVAGHMQYRARVPLPSEVDRGINVFKTRQQGSRIPLVAANLELGPGSGAAHVQHEPFITWEVHGVTVACTGVILGVTALPVLEGEAPVRILSARKSLGRVLRDMRKAKPGVLVLALYGAGKMGDSTQVEQLIATQPEFDVILLGSEGRLEWDRSRWRNVSQPYPDGREIGIVTVTWDRDAGRILHTDVRYGKVGNHVPEDEQVRLVLGAGLGRVEHQLNTVVGYVTRRLGGTSSFPGQSGIQAVMSRAIRERVECDIVLVEQGGGGYLDKGPVLTRDIYRAIPHLRDVVILSLTPVELRSVLAENAQRIGSPRMVGIDGGRYTLVLEPGAEPKVRNLLVGAKRPHGRSRVRVAVQGSLLDQASGFETIRTLSALPEVRAEIVAVDTRKLVAEYVAGNSPLDVKSFAGVEIVEMEGVGAH